MFCKCYYRTERERCRKQQRHEDHDLVDGLDSFDAQKSHKKQRRHGQKGFSHPHFVAEDIVVETELERPSQKESCKQRHRCHVGPENSKVGQKYEPHGQKAKILSAYLLLKGIYSACIRLEANHVLQVPCYD